MVENVYPGKHFSEKYSDPFPTEGKVQIRVIAYDRQSGKSSPVTEEAFDIVRKEWRIVSTDDPKANAVIDDNP